MWKRMKLEYFLTSYIAVLQSLSCVWIFVTPWTAVWLASKLMSLESVMPSNHLILCHPLLLSASIFPSIRVFSNESAVRDRWPDYWNFSFSISPSNKYLGLIKGLSRVFSNTTVQKHQFSMLCFLYGQTFTSVRDYWKNHSFDLYRPLSAKQCLCFWIRCLGLSQLFFQGVC